MLRKICTLMVVVAVFAVTEVVGNEILIYKWKLNGKDTLSETMEADSGILRRVKQAGYLVLEYNSEQDLFTDSVLIKTWKEKGNKTLFYTLEDFLGGNAQFKRKTTEKGDIIEITAIGENLVGMVKKGVTIKDVGHFPVPPKLKGTATWQCLFNSGKLSCGEAKTSLTLDKKRTTLFGTMDLTTQADDATDGAIDAEAKGGREELKDLKTKLDFVCNESFLSLLFGSKVREFQKADFARSIYGSMTFISSGVFQYLAVGTEDKFYAFPLEDGKEGELLRTDGKGNLYWGTIGSRDEYILNRDNHYGYQKASTIADFTDSVLAILKSDLDQDIINNITNKIDMDEFLQNLDEYISSNTENYFNEYITEHLDPTTVVNNMDTADINSLIEKLKKEETFITFEVTNIKKMLKGLGIYMKSGDSDGLFDSNLTAYIDATTILNSMDAADLSLLKSKMTLDNVTNTKNNVAGTAAPNANDDSDDGYSIGSLWLDITNNRAYFCMNASPGNAAWLNLNAGGAVEAADISGLDDAINSNAKLQHITVSKNVNLDKLSAMALDDGDTVNLSNMKAAIGAILDYMHNDMGVNPEIYDKENLK